MPVFVARVRLAGGDVERALTSAIRAVDPALPRPQVFPVDDVVAHSLARERFGATLLSVLAALALALTAFGIYGALAYTIQQRRREIGIRMALGASGQQVTHLVMVLGIVTPGGCSPSATGANDAAALLDAWNRQLRNDGPAWLIRSIASSYVAAYRGDAGRWPSSLPTPCCFRVEDAPLTQPL